MLRQIVSLGQQASEDLEPMSPSPSDEAQSPEARSAGRLAGVFRGLTGTKLAKSPSPHPSPAATNIPLTFPGDANVASVRMSVLPPEQMESFERLKTGTLNERIAAANSLTFAIADYPLNAVLEIWDAGKDLIESSKPLTARQAGWGLLSQCVKYAHSTDLERREYFQTLSTSINPEDFHLQLAALVDLTNHGRELSGFEYDIFPLLTKWLQETYSAARTARRQASRGASRSKSKAIASGQDKNFSLVFSLLKEVIKFNFRVADDEAIGLLVDKLLEICMNTSVEEDLRACINVIDAIVTFGTIPNDRLKHCIHVLSSIHCLVPNLQKDSWHTIANICKSHHGQSTVRILIDLLRTTDYDKDKDTVREIRGALSVLTKLLSKSVEKGYPQVPMALLADGLANISRSSSTKIAADILKLINSLFEGPDGRVTANTVDEDWAGLFRVAARCGRRTASPSSSDLDVSAKPVTKDDYEKGEEVVDYQLRRLISRVEHLLRQQIPDFLQRDECIDFFAQVQHALPDSAVTLVLDHYKERRCCFPSEAGWHEKLKLILEAFFRNRNRRPLTRLQALAAIQEIYHFLEAVDDFLDTISITDLIREVLFEIEEESDTVVLQETVAFVVMVADRADMDLFDEIVDSLKMVIATERSKAPVSMPAAQSSAIPGLQDQPGYFASQSLSNVVTRGYVQMFMRSMDTNVVKSRKTFNAIVHIARSSACETDARLTAMKMLFRLRADWAHRVYLTPCPESEGLARSLYRTEASLARKLADDAAQPPRLSRAEPPGPRPSRAISFTQGPPGERSVPVRSASGAKHVAPMTQRLWSFPDVDALPEEPSRNPSPVLFSRAENTSASDGSTEKKAALNMASLLETVLSIFHQGCDWEIYSFILVHLPAQLSNRPLFSDAITQIQGLRKVICELIRNSSFQEPPSPSGLRRPDVANCLFHSLATVMCYHAYFQKSDEDEIARTFMQGIADKTAKTCIHALSVCCHELPMSVSKSLPTILHKMSQVITQPFVAMHILEFLGCLSRLHSLYSNFREDEYRIVFGICFRYLQYVRDKKRSTRNSHASEPPTPNTAGASHSDSPGQQNPTDDLPQYVYALAYHVITFWFLALRINDRPTHIGWIAKNLFTDVDGSASNDEQAQITMDFMQRVAFTDANDSAEDPLFNEEHFGEILEKRWIMGNSIVAIKQAKETGWAHVTRRHPSGISCFTIRENFAPMASHQARINTDATSDTRSQSHATTLPSFVLLQLLAPVPQPGDPMLRPIPLPADDSIERAIRLFDRISPVDGHRVGVIYIGDGQTHEAEILANTMGSPEYAEFLQGLGTLTRLKDALFNTQGLDREYDSDGKYTFCWRDRVTEIVFHVTTQMPTNLEQDPQCILKKRHIGNDFVNIIFNDSGVPFKFDTFPSEFNYVNIIVTPNPRPSFSSVREAENGREKGGGQSSFFMVQVMSKPGFPEISPAAEPKMVSLRALPGFVRLLALNASVFSHVWANREGGEHVSSWRARLREINRLRERYGPRVQPAPSPPPSFMGGGGGGIMTGGTMTSQTQQMMDNSRPASSVRDSFSSLRRSSVATFFTNASTDPTSHRSSMLSVPTTENTEVMPISAADALVESADFSKWT